MGGAAGGAEAAAARIEFLSAANQPPEDKAQVRALRPPGTADPERRVSGEMRSLPRFPCRWVRGDTPAVNFLQIAYGGSRRGEGGERGGEGAVGAGGVPE